MQRVLFVLAIGVLVGCSTPGGTPTPDPTTPQIRQALDDYEIALERFTSPRSGPLIPANRAPHCRGGYSGRTWTTWTRPHCVSESIPLSPRWEKPDAENRRALRSDDSLDADNMVVRRDARLPLQDQSPLWETLTARYGDLVSAFAGK